MAYTTFPESGDTITEALWRALQGVTLGNGSAVQYPGGILSGFVVSEGLGLTPEVSAGEALVEGLYVESDFTDTTLLPASSTSWVLLKLTVAAGLVTAVGIVDAVGATPPANTATALYQPLARVVTDGSDVTEVRDFRKLWTAPGAVPQLSNHEGRLTVVLQDGSFSTASGATEHLGWSWMHVSDMEPISHRFLFLEYSLTLLGGSSQTVTPSLGSTAGTARVLTGTGTVAWLIDVSQMATTEQGAGFAALSNFATGGSNSALVRAILTNDPLLMAADYEEWAL